MTLDDLVQSIPDTEAILRSDLARWIEAWKKNDDSLERLIYMVEKWHGNVWFKDASVSDDFYRKWVEFKADVIEKIEGMTLNERLYVLGLLNLWDSTNHTNRTVLRVKVKANA